MLLNTLLNTTIFSCFCKCIKNEKPRHCILSFISHAHTEQKNGSYSATQVLFVFTLTTMMMPAGTRDEVSAAKLCRLIAASSLGSTNTHFEDIRRIVSDNPHCLNEPGTTGETPLFLAVNQRNAELVRYLLVARANANKTSSHGRTALHELASTSSHATATQDRELIQILKMHNASLKQYDANRSQPVDVARMYNAPDEIQKLLDPNFSNVPLTSMRPSMTGHESKINNKLVDSMYATSRVNSSPTPVPSLLSSSPSLNKVKMASRPPTTPELSALYGKSESNTRKIEQSRQALALSQAHMQVDHLLARADAHQHAAINRVAAERIEAQFPSTIGPYKLLYEKALAELKSSDANGRQLADDLEMQRRRANAFEKKNRDLMKEHEALNLEHAKAGEVTGELVEYKRVSHERLVTIQHALTKLKQEIKESDEVCSHCAFIYVCYCPPT